MWGNVPDVIITHIIKFDVDQFRGFHSWRSENPGFPLVYRVSWVDRMETGQDDICIKD